MKLIIRTGAQAGMEFSIDRPVFRIGRGSGNDLALQDGQASRQHAEISQQGDQLFIRDLGSTNGTFVNNEQIVGTWALQLGDQIRIGETTLTCQVSMPAAVPEDWEAQTWDEGTAMPATGNRQKVLVWGLVALAVVLLVALAAVVVVLLREKDATPTPLAAASAAAPTEAIVIAATSAPESGAEAEPTATLSERTPASEPAVTTQPLATSPPAQLQPTSKPSSVVSVSPDQLEQLPAVVQQYLGNVPPDQLPEVLGAQIQSLPPEQVQQIVAGLFPGVSPDRLPPVVAASFPQLPQQEIQGLLNLVFPGQAMQVPEMGPVGGRLALGVYDQPAGTHHLYLGSASGGPPTLLLEDASEPNFAPDGQWLVYFSRASDRLGLRLIKTDGTGDTSLTSAFDDAYPTFSPDGQRISFFGYTYSTLNVINRDGTARRGIGNGEYPAWSPTGEQIVYRGCTGGGRCGLIVANADGSNPSQITIHANDAAPRWSPNGGQIAFHSDRDGNWEIYVINADGSWLRRITRNPTTDIMPVWSPDGLRIAFRSDRGGKRAVWVTSGIGGAATKLFDAEFDPEEWLHAQMDWAR